MLKLENMFENFDLVREALAFWAHDEENLEDMLGYFRISSNAVYPFTAGGKVCFLRLAPVDEKVEGDILGELEFIRYLRGQGYPALKAVASVSGEELLRLETVYGCFYASVFEGVDGVQMVDSGYPREAVYAYGRALDLAQVWNSLEDELEGEKERLPEIKKTFLEGYAEEYAYTQETESMLALMRRFVNLRSYARLIRCVSSRMAEEPDWLVELREKLNGKIRALEDGFR